MLTLLREGHALASAREQVRVLEGDRSAATPRFQDQLRAAGRDGLRAAGIRTLQINVGKVCNQTCSHCHVDAGPDRREQMDAATIDACLRVLSRPEIETLDITGGAPEMHPHFRRLVTVARELGKRVIDRCNLTILLAPGYADLAEFLADQQVEVIASLPCYLEENCDRQRGAGVFERSIAALRRLNELGYGQPGGLDLALVYNPTGLGLPGSQSQLEADYREQLRSRFGVEFTRLYTITNMPISRFLADLLSRGEYDRYLAKLVRAFNPDAVDEVMCRTMLSVDWRGRLYDCDFNQMLELEVAPEHSRSILDLDFEALRYREIVVGRHCFGCTAGAGSSCGGALRG